VSGRPLPYADQRFRLSLKGRMAISAASLSALVSSYGAMLML
jgi:hypothetical protein